MNILHVDITQEQKENLRTLSEFLKRSVPPPNFAMNCFLLNVSFKDMYLNELPSLATKEIYSHCDTVACAVGHGPLAGIQALESESWRDYAFRVFGASSRDRLFAWCFDGYWAYIDNTPQGASFRIDFVLRHGGVPLNYNGYKCSKNYRDIIMSLEKVQNV